jgi:hypothetical protein
MRVLGVIGAIIGGVVLVALLTAATGIGGDHTGQTVRASVWADDVCGTVGAWEGDLHAIRDELGRNSLAARRSDGTTGDSVEQTVTLRTAVDRAIVATTETLQKGLRRAGTPHAPKGVQAATIMTAWALRTETNLRIARKQLQTKPASVSDAFAAIVYPATALTRSFVEGRAAFASVAALDPALSDALNGSRQCRDLQKDEP